MAHSPQKASPFFQHGELFIRQAEIGPEDSRLLLNPVLRLLSTNGLNVPEVPGGFQIGLKIVFCVAVFSRVVPFALPLQKRGSVGIHNITVYPTHWGWHRNSRHR